jgi:hypothetical protein
VSIRAVPFVFKMSASERRTVQYMLLIYNDENAWAALSEAERGGIVGEYFAFTLVRACFA